MNDPGRVFLTQLAGEWMHTRHENMSPYLRATVPEANGCCGGLVINYIKKEALKAQMTIELQQTGVKWVYRGFDKQIEAHVTIGHTYHYWNALEKSEMCETCQFDPLTQTMTWITTPGRQHNRPDGREFATIRFTASGELEIETTYNLTGVKFKAYWKKCGQPVQQYVPVQQPVQQPVQLEYVQRETQPANLDNVQPFYF